MQDGGRSSLKFRPIQEWQSQCCECYRMSAISNWTVPDTEFPVNGTCRQKLGSAVKFAAMAWPNDRWQPWEFRTEDDFVELIARERPQTAKFDPEGRETTINCGAALQYLKLFLKHHRCLGRVELFPELDDPALMTRIHAGGNGERDAQESHL